MHDATRMPGGVNRPEATPVQRAVWNVLHDIDTGTHGMRCVGLVIERLHDVFLHSGLGDGPEDDRFDEVDAIILAAAALLKEVKVQMESARDRHCEAVK